MPGFKLYEADPDAWDWKGIMLVSALLRAPTIETFLLGLALLLCLAAALCTLFLLQLALSYVYKVYTTHGTGTTRSARILQGALILFVVCVATAYSLYNPYSLDNRLSWEVYSNIIGWSILLFSCTVIGVDSYEKRRAGPQPTYTPSNVRSFLNWKAKQKQP